MTMQELFEFVMSDAISDVDSYLASIQSKIAGRSSEMDARAQIEEGVFMGAPVIRRLDELIDHEKEFQKLKNKTVGFHGAIAAMTVHDGAEEKATAAAGAPASGGGVASKSTKPTSTHSAKPSAKSVSAPEKNATDRGLGASTLFAGLLLPQVEDQEHLTNDKVEPGYVSNDEDDEEEEDEDDESDEDAPIAAPSRPAASKSHAAHSAKPSAKAVSAPEKNATDRGIGASTLFAGLLLPQLEDQLTLTNSVPEPGYVSSDESAEDDEDDLARNANHTELGGRRVMTHVRKGRQQEEEESSDEEDDDANSNGASSPSGSDDDDDAAAGEDQSEQKWEDRPKTSAEEQRAARKAAKKDAKAAQAEKRKTKIKKKDKKAKVNKGKH